MRPVQILTGRWTSQSSTSVKARSHSRSNGSKMTVAAVKIDDDAVLPSRCQTFDCVELLYGCSHRPSTIPAI